MNMDITSWLKKNCKVSGNITVSNGLVNVDGDIKIINKITKILVKFGVVTGNFWCSGNQLISLEGAPNKVGGNFDCSYNQLTSLVGAPDKVGGGFHCYGNQLTSLVGAPKLVGGGFYCFDNQLTSLDGLPDVVGDLRCDLKDNFEYKWWKIKRFLR